MFRDFIPVVPGLDTLRQPLICCSLIRTPAELSWPIPEIFNTAPPPPPSPTNKHQKKGEKKEVILCVISEDLLYTAVRRRDQVFFCYQGCTLCLIGGQQFFEMYSNDLKLLAYIWFSK